MRNHLSHALIFGVLGVSLAGCGANAPDQAADNIAASSAASPAAMDADARNSALLATAEPFEALTEQAATSTTAELDKLIADTRSAANRISGSLDQAQEAKLQSQLAEVAARRKSDDRTGIALAAVEGYRTLIESAPDTSPTPRAVSLLDYAGFRYQANLAAKPARWADAGAAVDFADTQWAAVSPKIGDTALRSQMSASIVDMRKAVQAKDEALAKSASTTELDLVDKLEAYFTTKK